MIASILQLAGGILLAISAFKGVKFYSSSTIPVVGLRPTAALSLLKEKWITRIGLSIMVLGYLVQIGNYNITLSSGIKPIQKIMIGGFSTIILSIISLYFAHKIAKYKYKKIPVFNPNKDTKTGTVAIFPDE